MNIIHYQKYDLDTPQFTVMENLYSQSGPKTKRK